MNCRRMARVAVVRSRSGVVVWLVRGRRGVADGVGSVVDALLSHVVKEISDLSYNLLGEFDRSSVPREEAR